MDSPVADEVFRQFEQAKADYLSRTPGALGPVEGSVRADLDRLGKLDQGVRGSLAQMALRMARAYDRYEGADLTKLARANQELRATLQAIAEVGDDGDPDEAARISTPEWSGGAAPVRDAEVTGSADVGAADSGGGGAAG